MGGVVLFDGLTSLDIPADRVLDGAVGVLDCACLAGITKSGKWYFASSTGDGRKLLEILKAAQDFLTNADFDISTVCFKHRNSKHEN